MICFCPACLRTYGSALVLLAWAAWWYMSGHWLVAIGISSAVIGMEIGFWIGIHIIRRREREQR